MGSRSSRTPNGIRTRAATLKGWYAKRTQVSVVPDETKVLRTNFFAIWMLGIVWAFTLSLENSNRSIQGPRR